MTFELEKSVWANEGYYYLSKEDSDLYDAHKDKNDEASKTIVKMILEKAESNYARHCASKY